MICKSRARAFFNRCVTERARIRLPEQGYTLAGVLVLIAILSIFMAMSVPIWERVKQRENEEELIFRGKEYVEAIARYHQKFNSYPPDIKTLYDQKFLRRLYKDPMTKSGTWKLLHPDSLVETGAAGAINQPGSKNPSDQGDQTQKDSMNPAPGTNDKSNQHNNSSQNNDSSQQDQEQDLSSKENAKDEGEEPEASPDDKEVSLGPLVGVVSRSKKSSLLIYNGQSAYNKWIFAYVPQQQTQQQPPPGKNPGDKGGKNPKPPAQPPTPGTNNPGGNNPGTNQNDQNNNDQN